MANNGKAVDGGQSHDGYPQVTKGDMADKDQSQITTGPLKAEAVAQAHSLVGLVLAGENPMKLMNRVIDQIHESVIKEEGGGPYHVGSTVRINTAGTYEKIGGGSQSLGYRDVVSIINPFLGEQGKDAMVLMSDGVTRCIVPWKSLGESIGWLKEADVDTGPDAFMGKPQTGKQLTADGEFQDDKEYSDAKGAQPSGAGSPVTLGGDSQVQGDGAPGDEPSARAAGQSAPSTLPKDQAVEQRREVLQALDMFMEASKQLADYRRMNEIRRHMESTRNIGLIGKVHGMLFSESKNFSIKQVARVVEQDEPKKDDDDKDNPFPQKEKCWSAKREGDDDMPFPKKDDDEPKEGDEDPDDKGAGQFGGVRTGEDDDEPSMDPTAKPLQPAEGDDDWVPDDDDPKWNKPKDEDDPPGGAGPGVTPPMEDGDDPEDDDDDDKLPPMEARRRRTEAKLRRLYGEDTFPGMTGDSASDGQPKPSADAGMTGDAADDAGKKKDPKAGVTGDTSESDDDDVGGDSDPDDDEPKVEADGAPDPGKKNFTSPQGGPGRDYSGGKPEAPGIKESKRALREGYKQAVSSIFRRLDESR